jgi:hypothetical protein
LNSRSCLAFFWSADAWAWESSAAAGAAVLKPIQVTEITARQTSAAQIKSHQRHSPRAAVCDLALQRFPPWRFINPQDVKM